MPAKKAVALVTGANGAIGQAIAEGIAATPGFEVVLACRNEQKAGRAAAEVRKASGNGSVRYELVDVSRRESIDNLARRWDGPLHVLVNNAAASPRQRMETPEGIEVQFARNVLGYLWMAGAFAGHLAADAPARVVNVASYWAGGLELDDLEFTKRPYDNDAAYRQSKQADRMLTLALAERLKDKNVTVNACHPGDVASQLASDLRLGGHQTPQQAAETPVMLATQPPGAEQTGKYFEHGEERPCSFCDDRQAVDALYTLCESYA